MRAPILIAHGVFDATAAPDDAREIASGVGSLHRELLWLPSSAHVVPVDLDGLILAEAVAEHCVRFTGTGEPRPAEQS